MNRSDRCERCGRIRSVPGQLAGRKVRCPGCGHIKRMPLPSNIDSQRSPEVYPLVEVEVSPVPAHPLAQTSLASVSAKAVTATGPERSARVHASGKRTHQAPLFKRLIQAAALETSRLERESAALILLSAADLLVTYALLKRGPSYYESNPVAQWVFARWNIAGMTLFKFAVMAFVVVIGEVVEHHRPGWGRTLLTVSCLVTGAVVWYGLRLLTS